MEPSVDLSPAAEADPRLQGVFDNSMDAVLLTTPDGRITMANGAATELFGWSEAELRDLGPYAIVDPSDARLRPAVEQRRRTGRFRGELTMVRRDGSRFPVELSSTLFRDARGGEWISLFVRDIGLRKAHEAERERLLAQIDAERRYFQTVLETVPMAVILVRTDGSVYVNPQAEQSFGSELRPEAGSAQYADRILYPDGRPVPRAELPSERVLRSGETLHSLEFLVVRADGSRMPILGSAAPIRDARQQIIGAVGLFQDVSERMRSEAAIRARERLLSAVFDILPVGLWVADEAGRFVRHNDAALQIYGRPRQGVADLAQQEGWWADSGERVAVDEWPLQRALRGERRVGRLMRIHMSDGRAKTIINSALPICDELGQVTGAVVLHQDVTRLKEAEEALQRAVRSRDQVLGLVAHDLRNPLNAIVLNAQRLKRKLSIEAVDAIEQAARHMNRMVQDLLDVARLDQGALSMRPAPLEVRPFLDELLAAHEPSATAAGLFLEADGSGAVGRVEADRDRLAQVFDNLIGNALKFSFPAGHIRIGARAGEHTTRFWVSDGGPGIAPDHLPHLFDRFWQADRHDRRGAGLGLAIVKGIVEAQGGRIWVESRVGAGTTFFFELPNAA